MGNRGILHGDDKILLSGKWRHKAWVICVLAHTDKKGRAWHREVMRAGHYTELFFLDEATALGAGHRPCALCQRDRYKAYMAAAGFSRAPDLDKALHRERTHSHFDGLAYEQSTLCALPPGAMIATIHEPGNGPAKACLWDGSALHPWSHDGYAAALSARKDMIVHVLTPPISIDALRKGYALTLP